MKILVCVKRVIDANIHIRVKEDHSGVETTNVKMSINPFDEIAIEEAVRLKEAGTANEVIVTSIGPENWQEIIRAALALGADRGMLVVTEQTYEPLNIAKILHAIVNKVSPDLIIMGKQSIDGDNNQTGQMLAGLLAWPQATFASNIECKADKLIVSREVDGGIETLSVSLPAVVTTDLRLNEPRYATLPNIMKARQKPLEKISLDDLELELNPHLNLIKVEPPSSRKQGIKVESVEDLVRRLREEAKVI